MKKIVPLIVMHTDANVSSSNSFESLNFAVIFPQRYGTISEKNQVTAYFTDTSGIAECKKTEILHIKLIFTTKNANICYNSFMMVHV